MMLNVKFNALFDPMCHDFVLGAPILSKTDPSQEYGQLNKNFSLTCTEQNFTASDIYSFKRNGIPFFDQTTLARTKYIPTVSNGSVVMNIISLDQTDEGIYLCEFNFLVSPVLTFAIEGKRVFVLFFLKKVESKSIFLKLMTSNMFILLKQSTDVAKSTHRCHFSLPEHNVPMVCHVTDHCPLSTYMHCPSCVV